MGLGIDSHRLVWCRGGGDRQTTEWYAEKGGLADVFSLTSLLDFEAEKIEVLGNIVEFPVLQYNIVQYVIASYYMRLDCTTGQLPAAPKQSTRYQVEVAAPVPYIRWFSGLCGQCCKIHSHRLKHPAQSCIFESRDI